ncbi:acyl-ACP--UDP-N-acetylglucosamine O-acyltransferase [Pelagicoccus sp. SDUM812005]|uniref:acyl-ACP--UDP-N-acetylglucosamine O-acyltransferase n=1 Tax=Pelagicoccus sp. SDUM812005 TaxID=3041257 RepID=UPI00280C896D|nr:acyl-ACP--UDP-N-acetylglucosamine O-acyltransferase [Pelagicoccus sp. SDUM812005]MDQ8179263.1 acyl-ACP--UDP-N-acetylglucosamine O-acyltransferase [Pelagicoccus sp. SDUM812005]
MASIHSSAIVSSEAILGEGVEIGPYAIVEGDVEIGAGSKLEAHAVLKDGARIGKSVTVGNFAVVAGLPQDLSFDPSIRTFARIGDKTTLREGVTINRATKEGGCTVVGESCFVMAEAHVGHDSVVGNKVVVGNASLLGGHVSVGDSAFLGGCSGIHQFCRIGESVMFGGQSTATMDVAPFTIFAERNTLFGLNLVGLRRRGFSKETIAELQRCYRKVFLGTGNMRVLAAEAKDAGEGLSPEAVRFLDFFAGGKRGFATPGRSSK